MCTHPQRPDADSASRSLGVADHHDHGLALLCNEINPLDDDGDPLPNGTTARQLNQLAKRLVV